MRRPLKLEVPFTKMGVHKIGRTMEHFRDIKNIGASRKLTVSSFFFSCFFPINDLEILKVGRRLATSQQHVPKNTDL